MLKNKLLILKIENHSFSKDNKYNQNTHDYEIKNPYSLANAYSRSIWCSC